MMADPAPLLVDSKTAARMLAISPRTLWAMQKSGELPVVRIRRSIRFDVKDLEAWIEGRKGLENGEQKYINNNGRDASGRYLRKKT